jgi:hypothetical protein
VTVNQLRTWLSGIGLCAIAVGNLTASAQTMPRLSSGYAPGAIPGGGGIAINAYPVVLGKPFRAEADVRVVRTLPNGTQATYEYHGIVARDSKGRVLRETPTSPRVPNPTNPGSFFVLQHASNVTDPVTNMVFRWDDGTKEVYKQPVPSFLMNGRPLDDCEYDGVRQGSPEHSTRRNVENLGTRTMQGILVRGCRVTMFFPATEGVPNSEDVTVKDERWSSYDLRVTLLLVRHDLNGDDITEKIEKLERVEPDPTSFQPPTNYSVQTLDPDVERLHREPLAVPPEGPEPLAIAGPWEMEDPILGKDTIVGFFLKVDALYNVQSSPDDSAKKVLGRYNSPLEILFYQRAAGDEARMWFATGQGDAYWRSSSWDGYGLKVRFNDVEPGGVFAGGDFVLDLTFDPKSRAWTGAYSREGETKQALLGRPGASGMASPSSFVGTWMFPRPQLMAKIGSAHCLNIARGADNVFLAWETFGGPPSGNGNRYFGANAGMRWGITVESNKVTLDEGAYTSGSGGGISLPFTGTLSADGTQIVRTSGVNGAPIVVLTKTSDEACSGR